MEILSTKDEYFVISGEYALHCCRKTGKLTPKTSSYVCELKDPSCLGVVCGVLGRLSLNSNKENYLLLIKTWKNVGAHPLNKKFIFKIQEIIVLPLNSTEIYTNEQVLNVCKKHHRSSNHVIDENVKKRANVDLTFLQKQQKKVFKATAESLKFVSNQVTSNKQSSTISSEEVGKNKLNNTTKLLDEILKLFNENSSFYYSECDLTNPVEKIVDNAQVDERYFWNRFLLSDIQDYIHSHEKQSDKNCAQFWLKPIIQGYVESRILELDSMLACDLTIISRRSVKRAGTRYIKRGVDEYGFCANFVETEQILTISGHLLSFLQIRASIPLFWSQPGYKYKPPPRIDKTKSENTTAFQQHFRGLQQSYNNTSIAIVNLVDQMGKERILSDSFLEYTLEMNFDNLLYIAFDFHEYCRGMKFENVSILVDSCSEIFQNMKFTWLDKKREFISRQTALFRVNCVDCLDRTNVVQSAFAKFMLECQLRKLGLLSPDDQLSKHCHNVLQIMWANNGDAISRQYAGTAALKGDFTRTGQRNFAGMVRDGYNSANRYYLCHVKDARRQAAIDMVLGQKVTTSDIENVVRRSIEEDEKSWVKEKDEHLRLLVLDCEKLVIPEDEILLASWALIDADTVTGDESEDEMDTVVLLTRNAYYVASYDEQLDKFVDIQRVPVNCIEFIEAGPMTISTLFGVSRIKSVCLRINYLSPEGGTGYFHVWRAGGTRLFNNLAISIKSPEEANEYVYAITEQFNVALQVAGYNLPLKCLSKLERKKSKVPLNKSIERKNAGFMSNLLSPLASAGAKTVGTLLKSSSATGKFFAQNNANSTNSSVPLSLVNSSRDVSSCKISLASTPTVVFRPNEKIFKSSDVMDDNCGILFTSTALANSCLPANQKSQFFARRFSVALTPPSIRSPMLNNSRIPLLNLPNADSPVKIDVLDNKYSQVHSCLKIADNVENRDQQTLKMSRSESALKKLETDILDSEKKVEKSSSSTVLEKIVDGRKFFQNFGSNIFTGAKKHSARNWQEYEERIKCSRTKFILL